MTVHMLRTKRSFVVAAFTTSLILAASLIGCTSQPSQPTSGAGKSAKAPQQAAEFATGREGFQKVYGAARQWATDAQPIRIQSMVRKENMPDGKSTVWGTSFASPGRHMMKPFIWSGAVDDSLEQGVNPGNEDTYSPTNISTTPFDVSSLQVDSDKALEVANQHGGKALLKKDPTTPLKYECVWDPRANQLSWHVIYGTNENTAKLVVLVDASTGKFIRASK